MRALVTGASRGIGRACAVYLALADYEVIINYNRSEAAALTLAEKLNARAVRADVSNPAEVRRMLDESGGVDVLVCNAGISKSGLITDYSDEDIARILDVNLLGTINCIRAALPHMIHEKHGSIITVSSMWGVSGASFESVYSASKAAVIGLTKALAKELGPSGIRVNCVAPGVIDTDMNSGLTPADIDVLRSETPLGAIGRPEHVASAVTFLASDAAEFITGQVLGVDGGFIV